MGKPDRIPVTTEAEQEVQDQPQGPIAPVEMIFHLAGVNIEKFPTPGGTLTLMQILSPTGIAVTVRLSDDDVDKIVGELKGISIVTSPGLVLAR